MDWDAILTIGADVAAIITGVVAVTGGCLYLRNKLSRRSCLEHYLEAERRADEPEAKSGTRSVLHLMGHLSMTEAEVLEAAFGSKSIRTWIGTDESGRPDRLLFQSKKRPPN
jgi:hypothetical protein